jgi:hypothetical protein
MCSLIINGIDFFIYLSLLINMVVLVIREYFKLYKFWNKHV